MANLDPDVTRTSTLGKGVHVSNPPGYSKVFSIWTGSAAVIAINTVLPAHRALLITGTGSVAVTNSDGTTSTLTFTNVNIVLPIQIKSYNTATGLYIYGLL